jgi:imidazolonepropionase-like amidohydrolase
MAERVTSVFGGHNRGIPVLSGSDTGNASAFSHGKWHGKEAELFVKQVGMTPMEAIVANTSGNAAMVNLAGEVGVIAPGKLADIVIWDKDPIADITVLQRPAETSLIASFPPKLVTERACSSRRSNLASDG